MNKNLMWQTWHQAKTYHLLPSEIFDPTGEVWEWGAVHGPLARWQFNTAVTWFGTTIENALQERVKVGVGTSVEYKPKYTLARLLHPDFRLPKPAPSIEDNPSPWAPLLSWIGKKGAKVRRFMYKKPVDEVSDGE